MSRFRWLGLSAAIAPLICMSAWAQGGIVNSTKNPQQLATLHWYAANQTTTFQVGNIPSGVTFDGANMWVVNGTDNTVEKLRANDGAAQGTFAVGQSPQSVAFDGANVWVANFNDNTVTKLRAADGVVLGTFAAGQRPNGLAFDGANIWVSNFGDNTVTKIGATHPPLLHSRSTVQRQSLPGISPAAKPTTSRCVAKLWNLPFTAEPDIPPLVSAWRIVRDREVAESTPPLRICLRTRC